jgi:phosphoribosylanthranilate isomerase
LTIAAKICGLSSEAAVEAAIAGGASYVGFVFYPPSPRSLSPARAAELCRLVPAQDVHACALFVDADDATIAEVLAAAPIDILQLHGRETPERVAEARRVHKRPVMKAVPIAGPEDVALARRWEDSADMLLFDAKPPRLPQSLPGGNGLAFDWQLLAGQRWKRPWMLSGGLTPENLAEAVRTTGATMVDVSSGVERRPGEKDPAKVAAFLEEAKRL